MEKLFLNDGQEVNLVIKYENLFNFQRKYKDIAKDLIQVVSGTQSIDHETVVQMLYVGYLGGNNEEKLTYEQFLEKLDYDFNRDMVIFNNLVKKKDPKN